MLVYGAHNFLHRIIICEFTDPLIWRCSDTLMVSIPPPPPPGAALGFLGFLGAFKVENFKIFFNHSSDLVKTKPGHDGKMEIFCFLFLCKCENVRIVLNPP